MHSPECPCKKRELIDYPFPFANGKRPAMGGFRLPRDLTSDEYERIRDFVLQLIVEEAPPRR